jgi:YbbR-like protein
MASQRPPFGAIAVSLTLAMLLWGYVSLTRTYEDYIDVPFTVLAPPEQALLSTVPDRISVRARGSGWRLLNLRMLPGGARCTLDLSKLRPTDGALYQVTKNDLIRGTMLPQSVQTLDVDPGSLVLAVGDLGVRSVPVALRYRLEPREGFVVTRVEALPATVNVRGSKARVDSVVSWPTQRIIITDAHDGVDVPVALADSLPTLLNVVPSTVRLRADVQQKADRQIDDIPITVIQPVGTRLAHVRPDRVSIVVRGGVNDVARLDRTMFTATIDEAAAAETGYARVRVAGPDGVAISGISPAIVTYRLRLAHN